jgi:hypothetical protein
VLETFSRFVRLEEAYFVFVSVRPTGEEALRVRSLADVRDEVFGRGGEELDEVVADVFV